jgi:hypothetical protein
MIHILLINMTPEAEWIAWRAAQRVWGRCISIQSVTDAKLALDMLMCNDGPCPSLALLGTGPNGDCDQVIVGELRAALGNRSAPLVGLADTSWGLDRLRARQTPLDWVMLSPVQMDALKEMALALNLEDGSSYGPLPYS